MSTNDWFKTKKYLHFDCPLQDNKRSDIESLVKNPDWVSKHSFYPFITYQAPKYKFKTDQKTQKRFLDDSKTRPIAYAAHLDAVILGYYSSVLSEKYERLIAENELSDTVIAFRKIQDNIRNEPKSNIHLARDSFNKIREIKNCTVFAFDITKFFDTLKANHLKDAWKRVLGVDQLPIDHYKIFKVLTKFSVVDKDKLFAEFKLKRTANTKDQIRICEPKDFRSRVRDNQLIQIPNQGIPQGSPISAILANIYMLDFDVKINEEVKRRGGVYFRYCDDILCIVPEENMFDVEAFVSSEINSIGLNLNSDKTDISRFALSKGELICDKPINYLGFVFGGKNVYIRTSSISKYIRKAKAAVELSRKSRDKINSERLRKGLDPLKLYRKDLFKRYFHTGKTNFIRYGLRSAEIMSSSTIKRQIKKLNRYILELTRE